MDKDKSGVLDMDDIKEVYNAKKHPDVIAGKKTEQEILGEFLDTFEMHYSLNVSNNLIYVIKLMNSMKEARIDP